MDFLSHTLLCSSVLFFQPGQRLIRPGRVVIHVSQTREVHDFCHVLIGHAAHAFKRDWYIVTKTEHDFAKYLTESGKIESLK